jgi:predicted ATPase
MLETIREYALERLRQDHDFSMASQRHADFYLALAEKSEPEIWGPQQEVWLERLEREHDNFRAALAWSFEHEQAETAARLAGALEGFWEAHGHISEGRRWLGEEPANKPVASGPDSGKGALWSRPPGWSLPGGL